MPGEPRTTKRQKLGMLAAQMLPFEIVSGLCLAVCLFGFGEMRGWPFSAILIIGILFLGSLFVFLSSIVIHLLHVVWILLWKDA